MGTEITYFTRAENDFLFLKFAYDNRRVDDAMGYLSQSICERYLKHVIDVYCLEQDTSVVLRTHSLRVLSKFLKKNLGDFICDWGKVLKCDGYYFSARYPGNEAVELDRDDIEECWEAVLETRACVTAYLDRKNGEKKADKEGISDKVVRKLNSF